MRIFITDTTTLGELAVRLAAFGVRCYVDFGRDDGYIGVSLVDSDGIEGAANGATLGEAMNSAFAFYATTKGLSYS